MTMNNRTDIGGLELHDLEVAFESRGYPRFHARQVFQWIHKRGVTDFAQMSDLSRELRQELAHAFEVQTPKVIRRDTSSDGTTKLLLELADGKLIESVYIPDTPAQTFCISTQVG